LFGFPNPPVVAHSPKELLVFDDDDGDNDGDYVLDILAGLYGKGKRKGKVEREREMDSI